MLVDTFFAPPQRVIPQRVIPQRVIKIHRVHWYPNPNYFRPIIPVKSVFPKWWILGTTSTLVVFGVIFIAVAIAVSLIPFYLPSKTVTYQPGK